MGLAELTSLDQKLDAFLNQEISIGKSTRSSASTSQNYLRNILRGRAAKDVTFPELLSQTDCDFLGGSFARHTKIWPLDDIDVFFPMEGGGLNYVNYNGLILPYTVGTNGQSSRLTLDRWQTNTCVDSSKVLQGFKAVLRDSYPLTDISVDKHCVNVQLTVEATSESDGIGFDVVPCFLLRPWSADSNVYLIPNGTGGWMLSNPRSDNVISGTLQKYHLSTYRKAVRLVKFWNKYELGDSFQSYYIELVASKRFMQLQTFGYVVSSLAEAMKIAFLALETAYKAGSVSSLVDGAPDILAPTLSESRQGILRGDVARASSAYDQASVNSDLNSAFAMLNVIFASNKFFS